MTTRKAPAKTAPDKAAKPSEAEAKPAPKPTPAKAAPAAAKKAAAKPAEAAEKKTYAAEARCGKTNTRASATVLTHAVDVKIAGRKGAQYASGVIVGMFASAEKAQAAADEINAGEVDDWSDAIVVPVVAVKASA
jgi:hypothetical protein